MFYVLILKNSMLTMLSTYYLCDNVYHTILRPMSILMGPTNVCYHQLTMICAAVTFNTTSPRGLNVSCY